MRPGPTIPFRVSPMLATLEDTPFHHENWVYEEKYDGVRMLAYKEGDRVTLISRNAIDRSLRYPEIATAIGKLGIRTVLLDGEIVVFDAHNVSQFKLLQQGLGQRRFAVFDCLYVDGNDLRNEPLALRRMALEKYVSNSQRILLSTRVTSDGLKAFQIAKKKGFEGIVAKNEASKYTAGRSKEWLKVKVNHEEEFVIGGYTKPAGSRHYFGALLLGWYRNQKLQYAGKVGTGFNEESLSTLHKKLSKLQRQESPFDAEVREKKAVFALPELVAQISFTEWTEEGKLRHPVYLGLRDDKNPKEVVRQ